VLAGFNESPGFAEDRAVDEVAFCCSGVVEEIASRRLGLSGRAATRHPSREFNLKSASFCCDSVSVLPKLDSLAIGDHLSVIGSA